VGKLIVWELPVEKLLRDTQVDTPLAWTSIDPEELLVTINLRVGEDAPVSFPQRLVAGSVTIRTGARTIEHQKDN
jgi:hypothetical protein